MAIYKETKDYKLIHDNMLNMANYIEDGTIDCIITDPPYELGFMGKKWDGSGIAFNVEAWTKCFNALKDGGYLLAFGGTRTFHRIACAIEDAGFEIRDTIMYIYGSGFPKSTNVALAIDKKLGAQGQRGVGGFNVGGIQEQNNRKAKLHIGSKTDGSKLESYNDTKTEQAKQWKGWGTALKPAYEPIIVARKPMKTSVAENVIKNRVGGINIDECRVETDDDIGARYDSSFQEGNSQFVSETATKSGKRMNIKKPVNISLGRFPANIILGYLGDEYLLKENITKDEKKKVMEWLNENA